MAYVLGFLYADGYIEDAGKSSRTQYISFGSKDKEIIELIRSVLGSKHIINYRIPSKVFFPGGKTYKCAEFYKLRIGSKKWFRDLLRLGLVPKKSLIIKFPNNIPDKYFGHFVRGYFDGDGCVTIKRGRGARGQTILKGVAVIFTSGSRLFLEGLRNRAHQIVGFRKRIVYYGSRSRACYLKYNTAESVRWFQLFYGDCFNLFLKRKYNVFQKYFQLRPVRIDKETAKILNKGSWPGIQVV
ncbi:hypothetical protein KKG36_01460 [Patescibacteria group bacterium]|nr:hypothetical protein [Patescibacteria group bacterium]